jgi:hypothetical protein
MPSFFTRIGNITLGILITLSILHLPKYILPATATVSSEAIFSLINEEQLLEGEISSRFQNKTAAPYALPNHEIRVEFKNNGVGPSQMDINGDGLSDLIFSSTYAYNNRFQYVLLNNGQGFEKAYVCRFHRNDYEPDTYTGDCADPNNPL